jgi:transcriptional antiterminator RfaH
MTQDDPHLPWHLAQLRPNGLAMALRNLERQSVTVFAPTETRTERRGQKFVTREAPAFPGYVFVQPSQATGGIRAINATRGITKLVSLGPEPAVVPPDLMAALHLRFAPRVELPAPEFSPGDRVQILAGPLAEFIAQVEATAPQDRVYLLIDLMGRATRVAVDAKHLRGLQE